MSFYMTKRVPSGIQITAEKITASLQTEGFGVLTEIDLATTMKTKLDIDIRPYRIFGACNPHLAKRALEAERYIGLLMPCNVIVQSISEKETEVSIIDPVATLSLTQNSELSALAQEVRSRLESALGRM